MAIVLDITCPTCHESDPVRKLGITTYECTKCDTTFSHEDLQPEP